MNKNKWLITLLALTLPLTIHAEEAKNEPVVEEETFVVPEPASLSLKPENKFRETGRVVSFLLMQSHYEHPDFDDELSQEAFNQFLKALDPNRSYFYQKDIAQLDDYERLFDDALRTGRIELAYDFFALFEERFRERHLFALEQLEKPLDFNSDGEFEYDRREAEWPIDEKEMNAIWKKRVLNDALNLKLAEQTDEQIKDKLTKRYQSAIRRLSQTKSEDVFGYFMNSISAAIDPHTSYYTPRQFENFAINMSLKLQGIGAVLTQEDMFTKIVSIVNKGPADKSGQVHPNDKIIGVGQGEKGEMVDVIGWRNDDVVDLIRGEAGTIVRLQIIPYTKAGDGMPKTVELVREEIKLEDQAAKSKVLEVEQYDKNFKMGVIELPSFYSETVASNGSGDDVTSTTKDVARLIKEFNKQDIDGLVIDLRNNGGGSLSEVVNLVGLFIDKGPVVQGRDSRGRLRVLKDTDSDILYKGPLAVLVNGGSASASEIFAGAIQDYGRGIVLGENTFGKGTVQSVADLNQYIRNPENQVGALKLTVEKFYRVTGESTQNKGVKPDIEFPTIFDVNEYGESSYDNALVWDTIKSTNFKKTGGVTDVIPFLRSKHEERKTSSQEFSFLQEDIGRVAEQRDTKVVSLNYEKRLAERKRNDEIRLERENLRRKIEGLEPLKELASDEDSTEDDNAESASDIVDEDQKDLFLKEAGNILSDLIMIREKPEIAANFLAEEKSSNN
ncbi:MAG TPA: carboxy terminal-processing peptidase [Kangiella sp.]